MDKQRGDAIISDFLKEAIEQAKKNHTLTAPTIQRVLTKFANAMANYTRYCRTLSTEYYEESVLGFSEIPSLEIMQVREDCIVLLKLVHKITNVICNNFPNLHIQPEHVINKMDLLVQSLKNINAGSTMTTESKRTGGRLNKQCLEFIQSKRDLLTTVNRQLEQSREYMDSKEVETKVMFDLRKEIESIFPGHKLHIFGSQGSGLTLATSDCDFYCDITGNNYYTRMGDSNQKNCVEKVGNQLKRSQKFSDVVPILYAKVPIVKIFHKPTKKDCDISFKDGSAVENTALLKVFLNLDDRVRWVLTAVKLWADYNDINSFTSHGLSWLVLFYLMQAELVPPVRNLQTSCNPKMINEWNVTFKDPKSCWVPKAKASAPELFRGFFSWVVTTDLLAYCLSPYTGEIIPKNSFPKMSWLKNNKDIDINQDGLFVHDAFEHNQNIVPNVNKYSYENFKKLSRATKEILDKLTLH